MSEHDRSQLGAYALRSLEPAEVRTVDEHLAGCAECRDEVAAFEQAMEFLREVPAEAFLDGPPADGDLLLQRTVREVRAGHLTGAVPTAAVPPRSGRSRWLLAAAAVVIAAAGVGAGILVGAELDEPAAVPSVPVQSATAPSTAGPSGGVPAGTRRATVTDGATGVTMATSVEPRNGWSWVNVEVSGLRKGYECELRVTDKSGKAYVAGSWLISDQAAQSGARFGGGVVVPVEQVRSVELVTLSGKQVASTPL